MLGAARLQLCPCLPGPALVHPECAQAGQRPAILQTLQRQPAPGHCEALGDLLPGGTACFLEGRHLHHSPSTTAASRTSLGHSFDSYTLSSWPALRPPPCNSPAAHPAELAAGCVLALVGEPGHLGRRRAMWLGTRRSCGCSVQIMHQSVVRQKCQGPLGQCHLLTIPPPCPLRPRWLWRDVMLEFLALLPTPSPPIALKSLLCVRDWQIHEIFLFVFSSFHCVTKRLRSLMKK